MVARNTSLIVDLCVSLAHALIDDKWVVALAFAFAFAPPVPSEFSVCRIAQFMPWPIATL